MNIWLINPYDELPGEGPEQRYGCLARELAARAEMGDGSWEMGQVVWVSSGFRHRMRTKFAGDRRWQMEDGVEIVLVDAPSYQKNVSLGRLWSQAVWGRRVERVLKRMVASGELAQPDVILASSPPLEGARAGLRLAKFFGAKGVVDFMDDWPATWLGAIPAGGMGQGGWSMEHGAWGVGNGEGKRKSNVEHRTLNLELRNRVLSSLGEIALWPWFRMARWIYSHADAVSAQSQAFAERAKELGFKGEVHVCYLGGSAAGDGRWKMEDGGKHDADSSNDEVVPPTSNSLLPSPDGSAVHILYLGAMGRMYDIDTVLRAAVLAKEEGLNWRWTLAGEDPDGYWQEVAKAYGVQAYVSLPGYVVGDKKQALLCQSSLGLIPMNPASRVAIPYKAGDYLSAGLPVVSSLPGELSGLLSAYGAGWEYRYGHPKSLFARLRTCVEDPEMLQRSRQDAFRLFQDQFDRKKTYLRFAEWVESVDGRS
jgi:glycosyltransferase involved in cell wall biosynthesis